MKSYIYNLCTCLLALGMFAMSGCDKDEKTSSFLLDVDTYIEKIVFDENTFEGGLYRRKDATGTPVEVYSIDLQNEILGNDTQKEQFIMAILYGNRGFENQSDFETINNRFVKNLGIYLNSKGIYDKINNIKLKESIGVYYQEETPTINDDGSFETPAENADVPNANKTLKRVITYSIAE